ncbi:MAG: type II toxin-antitoxin system VapB family antitoxin [Hyphomicrobiales bacterium]|nr:type II toxin-antitoxin system VapB family antitoxin [Hyphomicrobiales bacterium]MBV9910579.1 type II toxin-antitoxin system VapB family antitoxin [Hyphomicrobiales bacterium]
MKTTIEISDPLLREARKLAEREGVTLRALVERGLRRVVTETKPGPPFKLRRASFKGKGLQTDMRDASWSELRDLAYEGRGG